MGDNYFKDRLSFYAAIFALMLAAANLRGGLVVIGPLVEDIRTSLSISAAAFGFLMTLPLLCFASFSLVVPWVANRLAPMKVVALALLILGMGAAARLFGDYGMMVSGTLALGAGVAILNVLIPSLVKGLFPQNASTLTGVYTLVLTTGAAFSFYSAIPMRDAFNDWHIPMIVWAILPIIALLVWLPMLRVKFKPAAPTSVSSSVWRLPRAWSLASFMGLQSIQFYVLATWLPRIFMDAGLSDAEAGLMTAIFTMIGIPAALLTPMIAAKLPTQRSIVAIITLIGLVGVFGIWLAPIEGRYLWVACLGTYGGASLSLALALIAMKSHDMRQATALSAMVQGVGYLLASIAPSLIGALYDWQQAWTLPMLTLVLLLIAQAVADWPISGTGKVDEAR